MIEFGILTDGRARDIAERVSRELTGAGHDAQILELTKFPIGDALPTLLQSTLSRFERVVVALARDSTNRDWVMAELDLDALYPRIFVAVSDDADLPDWASHGKGRVIHVGQPLPAFDDSELLVR
jgi:hypothetical protein